MGRFQTVDDLKRYVLRQLGDGVIDQEITDEHLNDAIEDAIDYYLEATGIGSYMEGIMFLHVSTPQPYLMPPNVERILEIMSPVESDHTIMYPILQDLYNYLIRGTMGGNKYDLTTVYLFNQRIETIKLAFTRKYIWNFSPYEHLLKVTPEPMENKILCIRYMGGVYRYADGMLNNTWIKRYATELLRIVWGGILSKYTGKIITGAVEVDGQTMVNNAKEEIDKLKTELYNRYSEPIDFIVG